MQSPRKMQSAKMQTQFATNGLQTVIKLCKFENFTACTCTIYIEISPSLNLQVLLQLVQHYYGFHQSWRT